LFKTTTQISEWRISFTLGVC